MPPGKCRKEDSDETVITQLPVRSKEGKRQMEKVCVRLPLSGVTVEKAMFYSFLPVSVKAKNSE